MHPEVAAGETTSFPSTISALTDDAPHVQGVWSPLAPVACADLNASTPTRAARTRQTLTRWRRPQNLTARGCRALSRSAMGRVASLRRRRVLRPWEASASTARHGAGPGHQGPDVECSPYC